MADLTQNEASQTARMVGNDELYAADVIQDDDGKNALLVSAIASTGIQETNETGLETVTIKYLLQSILTTLLRIESHMEQLTDIKDIERE